MRRNIGRFVLGLACVASASRAYEWRSHNRMGYNGRLLAWALVTDGEFRAFLEGSHEEIDTRAGDPFKDAFIDEDSTEMLRWSLTCDAREFPCYLLAYPALNVCTINHFHPPLPIAYALSLGEPDAISHAQFYFDLSVKLYKTGKCSEAAAEREYYFRSAARGLGHALHLVQDMGSPQHTPSPRPRLEAPVEEYPCIGSGTPHGWSGLDIAPTLAILPAYSQLQNEGEVSR